MLGRSHGPAAWALGLWLLSGAGAMAQAPQAASPEPAARQSPTPGTTQGNEARGTGLWERANLFGDLGGLRPALAAIGASFGLTETSEILGNPTGGLRRGVIYEGATEMSLGIDLDKAINLPGGIFNVSAYQIHGRGLSRYDLNNLDVVSSIEAEPATRLYELWYQQAFLDGKLDIRLGQLAAGQEFVINQYAEPFLNSTFGWPSIAAIDLPAGGPDFPLATPGARLRARPNDQVTLLLGVFNGNPGGPGTAEPESRNPSGANLRFQGTLVIAEAQWAVDHGAGFGLPATYKLGGWYSSYAFADPLLSFQDQIMQPRRHRGDWSVYAVWDQLVYRPQGAKEGGIGLFVRASAAPTDRDQVIGYVDGGVSWKGAFGRSEDSLGLAVGWTRIGGPSIPRGAESVIELTYQAQVAPWWQVQPDVQYIVNSGGGALNPGASKPIRNAFVLGVRTVVTF